MCCLVIAPLHCLRFVRDCLWAGNPPSQVRFPNQLLVREGEWCCSPVLKTTAKKTLEMILAVLAYLGLCLFLREEMVMETSVCFPVSCLAFSEKTCCSVCCRWRYSNLQLIFPVSFAWNTFPLHSHAMCYLDNWVQADYCSMLLELLSAWNRSMLGF